MSENVFTQQLPKHRFTEYSKAQFNIDMIEKRRRRCIGNFGKNKTDDDIDVVINSVGKIKEYQRLDYLVPEKQLKTVAKHISFTKTKRPELWPVKDEHSRPPYQDDLNMCFRL